MGCFSHRSKKKNGDVSELLHKSGRHRPPETDSRPLSSADYGIPSSSSSSSSTSDDVNHSRPFPLPTPSPQPVLKPDAYVLPHPISVALNFEDEDCKHDVSGLIGHSVPKGKIFPCDLQPLPPPKDICLKAFTLEMLGIACDQFSASNFVGDDKSSFSGILKPGNKGDKWQNIVISRFSQSRALGNSYEGLKERISELFTISCNHGSHLCRLLGFHADDGNSESFLVYEKLRRGSLHNLIFESSLSSSLDWNTRMKITLGTAQALSSIHDSCREQILYRDLRLSHIQVDAEYNSKLSGYSFVNINKQDQEMVIPRDTRENAYCAPETITAGMVTKKSNVWSFGVVLLELITGRKNMDHRVLKDKKNLLTWAKPFLKDENRLFLIMDSKLKGRFPSKGAKVIADLVLQCLQLDPTKRPSMKSVLEMVKSVQEGQQSHVSTSERDMPSKSGFIERETPSKSGAIERETPSKSGVIERETPSKYGILDRDTHAKFDVVQSPPLKRLVIPPRCAYAEGLHHYQMSAPLERVKDF